VIDEKKVVSLGSWGVKDMRVAFFFKLCRGLPKSALEKFVEDILAEARAQEEEGRHLQGVVDLFLLMFQTRDITSGKGERELFYWFLLKMHALYPETTPQMLWLIPTVYGSWKDVLLLLEMYLKDRKEAREEADKVKEKSGAQKKETKANGPGEHQRRLDFKAELNRGELGPLGNLLVDMFSTQLLEDEAAVVNQVALRARRASLADTGEEGPAKDLELELLNEKLRDDVSRPSLCAKWAPREGKLYGPLAKVLALRMDAERVASAGTEEGPTLDAARNGAYASYRRRVAALNNNINTVEIAMCDTTDGGSWAALNPAAIPARCLKRNRDAFFNVTKGPRGADGNKPRRSGKADRVACATKFEAHMNEAVLTAGTPDAVKVHGANLMPNEMVKVLMNESTVDMTIEAQWVDLRERLRALDQGGLSSFIAISDVSGSMSGIPMEVSIAMGILISELAGPAFKDQFITFDSNPTWHSLSGCTTLFDKVKSAMSARWGQSTNFHAAMRLVLEQCQEFNMSAEDVAQLKLAVFSDMQFDDSLDEGYARRGEPSGWDSKATAIASMWKDAGFLLPSGEAAVPRIVFWNLRGDTLDFPATADTPGVDMVSGYSAMGLKMFMEEGDLTSAPYEGYRKVLDNARYDAVRDVCSVSAELAKII